MFRSTDTPVVEPAPDVKVPADLVPLSHLELDLAAPVEGWPSFLAARGVEITLYDIGRMSISRGEARTLLVEQREREARGREKAAEVDRAAIEAYRSWRAGVWGGVPADRMPPGVAPAAVMLQASRDDRPRRTSPLEEALSNSEELTFHSIHTVPDES